MENKQKLAEKIHQTAVNKGWWKGERNLTEARMLIITELAEAVEADRADRTADFHSFNTLVPEQLSAVGKKNFREGKPFTMTNHDQDVFKKHFLEWIKDTVEDELADAYIRILDLMYYESDGEIKEILGEKDHITKRPRDNFAASIYDICRIVPESLSAVLYMIENLAEENNIDLAKHVLMKMEYNKLRPQKHGGKKY